ncbi:MAG: IPT/TIG domain-containing protein [Gemmatimonadetes bacterium]|nr:IPT/TIG domain-containing protein [Gemmatimonadota bacterium]
MGTGPVIASVFPSSGRAGEAYPIQVTVEGTGFEEEGNIVTFGGIPVEDLEASDGGTRIRFWVPKEFPSKGEAPPQIIEPGEYSIIVTTKAGTSEPVAFTLTRGTE